MPINILGHRWSVIRCSGDDGLTLFQTWTIGVRLMFRWRQEWVMLLAMRLPTADAIKWAEAQVAEIEAGRQREAAGENERQ